MVLLQLFIGGKKFKEEKLSNVRRHTPSILVQYLIFIPEIKFVLESNGMGMGEISESVEITIKAIGPAPPSRLSVSSPIKVSLFASLLNLKMSKLNSFVHSLRLFVND